MKPVGTISTLMACGVAFAATFLCASSAEAVEGKAVVRTVRGTASYSERGAASQPLRVGKVLGSGATVIAGVSSSVDLFLGENGPLVRVTSETTLNLEKLTIDRAGIDVVIETSLDLKAGTIQGNVKKLAATSKYEVKTPNTVCAIKGTDYQISADGVHHALTGSLLVVYTNPINRQPTQLTVNAGQTFIPPVTPTATSVPTVVPTSNLPNNVPPPQPPLPPPGPELIPGPVVVPEPFVSPGTGTSTSGRK